MEGSEDARSRNENDSSESGLDKSAETGETFEWPSDVLEEQHLTSSRAKKGDTDTTKLCQVIESLSNQLQGVEVGMKVLQSQQTKLETNMQEWLGTSHDRTASDEYDHMEQGESDNKGESSWQPTLFNLNQEHEDLRRFC